MSALIYFTPSGVWPDYATATALLYNAPTVSHADAADHHAPTVAAASSPKQSSSSHNHHAAQAQHRRANCHSFQPRWDRRKLLKDRYNRWARRCEEYLHCIATVTVPTDDSSSSLQADEEDFFPLQISTRSVSV